MLGALGRRRIALLVAAFLAAAVGAVAIALPQAGAQGAKEKVLVLGSTVTGGEESIEARRAAALGYEVVIAGDEEWKAMTAVQFAEYRGIILGDPSCGSSRPAVAESTARTWGPQVDGNAVIIGSDPVLHQNAGANDDGGRQVTEKGIDFALAEPGRTGAYITLSCYYTGVRPDTPVPMLDGLSGGNFKVKGVRGCFDDAHITATHPALADMTDADLSDWSCSVHEAFTSWPGDFKVLAIARDAGSEYTAADGSVGTPYILARGEGLRERRNISLAPETATGPVGSTHTVTARVVSPAGAPRRDVVVTFNVTAGPHVGTTGTGTTDANGQAAFAYTSTAAGTDEIVARFSDGVTQSSGPATMTWTPAPPPPSASPGPPAQQQQQQQQQQPNVLPPPVPGKTVNAIPAKGRVLVKVPGTNRFVPFVAGQQLPVGTVLDTRKGVVTLVTAADRSGKTQTGTFYQGVFRIGQSGKPLVTTLTLVGANPVGKPRGRAKARAAAKRPRVRRLWGEAKGRFRSRGNFSAATVSGTKWLVEDRCYYTLTRVRRGKVAVRDFARRKTVLLRKGKSYRAWSRTPRRCS